MATRHVSVCLLAVSAAAAIIVTSMLTPHEAEAALRSVKTCDGGTIEVNGSEKRILELHNKARTERGLQALCIHPALTKAARAHSQEMLDKDYTSHDSFNGESVKQRLQRFGYTFSGYSYYVYGENITYGGGTRGAPGERFKWWMSSSGHRANILNSKFRQVGIGVRTGTWKSYTNTTMYTVDFGTRRQ
jgi:uncharacterized protein YkwD